MTPVFVEVRKPERRVAIERPHRREHERSIEETWRAPESLREYLVAFREACDAEHPERLHSGAEHVESEPGPTPYAIAAAIIAGVALPKAPDSGGSHMGGPRWTADFRAYIDAGGSPFAIYVDDHGETQWSHPLRSALRRMDLSSSNIDRLAASFCYLLRRCHGNHREAWAAQLGRLADPALVDVADSWAAESLRRWWRFYVERPRIVA